MDINELIGKRLAELVDREKRDDFIGDMGWESQTYYEARSGRRVFRVGELAAMARASKKRAWEFVDPRGHSTSVSLSADGSTIGRAALLDIFGYVHEASSWHALLSVQATLGDLNSAVLKQRQAEEVLRAAHPSLPAYEWEDEK
jgi:hypothetical protein